MKTAKATTRETKVICSGVSSKHAKTWTFGEATRELVQNWIDVRSEFGGAGSVTWEDGVARIKDSGPGLEIRHLAFGENEKSGNSIGHFGEGMKSAFITLLRAGRKITIQTRGQYIRPFLAISENFGIETLHYEISPMPARLAARMQGTCIYAECTEAELEEGKSYFTQFARKSADEARTFEWVENGKISLPGGSVYVNGSRIGEISNAHFSYHFNGSDCTDQLVNRDRNAVDMTVAGPMIANLICETSSRKVMEYLLAALTGSLGDHSWEAIQEYDLKSDRARLWKRVWNTMFSDKTVIGTYSMDNNEARYRGYTVLSSLIYSQRAFLESFGVKTASEVVENTGNRRSVGKVGVRSLESEEYENLMWAKRMVRKHYAEVGKVQVAERPQALVGCGDDGQVNGLYDPNTGTIYLNRAILTSREQTLHTLLHEKVHQQSGAGDLTAAFERALLNVAVGMIMKKA